MESESEEVVDTVSELLPSSNEEKSSQKVHVAITLDCAA